MHLDMGMSTTNIAHALARLLTTLFDHRTEKHSHSIEFLYILGVSYSVISSQWRTLLPLKHSPPHLAHHHPPHQYRITPQKQDMTQPFAGAITLMFLPGVCLLEGNSQCAKTPTSATNLPTFSDAKNGAAGCSPTHLPLSSSVNRYAC